LTKISLRGRFLLRISRFIAIASRTPCLRGGLTSSVIVGTAMVAIDQVNVILNGNLVTRQHLKIGLTNTVPFGVSSLRSVSAIRDREDLKNA